MIKVIEDPIILFCSERSGSNLITRIFDAHPRISGPGTAHLFRVFFEANLKKTLDMESSRQIIMRLFRAKLSQWSIDAIDDGKLYALIGDYENGLEMAAALYQEECRNQQKQTILIKENSAYRYWKCILSTAVRGSILFLVRDPRDMAVSWTRGAAMRGGVVRAAKQWVADQSGYLNELKSMELDVPHSFLRYEDLLLDPEKELQRVCGDLGVNYSSEMLDFSTKSASARNDATRSAMWSNLDKPLLRNNTHKFLTELNDDQIAYIEDICGPLMAELGYEKHRATYKRRHGQFDSLSELEGYLSKQEPVEKALYYELPETERHRYENWHKTYLSVIHDSVSSHNSDEF